MECLEALLSQGADVSIVNDDGQNALHAACNEGKLEIVARLLGNMTEEQINLRDNYQMTPFHLACENGFFEVVESLVSGANIPQLLRRGSACFLAEKNGHSEIISYLANQDERENPSENPTENSKSQEQENTETLKNSNKSEGTQACFIL